MHDFQLCHNPPKVTLYNLQSVCLQFMSFNDIMKNYYCAEVGAKVRLNHLLNPKKITRIAGYGEF